MTARTVTVDADDLEELLELVAQGLAALEWTTRARLRAEEYADVPIMGMWALPGGGAESMPPLGATEQRLIERVRNALRGGGRGTGGPTTGAQRPANAPVITGTAPPPTPCRRGVVVTHDPPGPTGPHLAALRLGAGLSRRIPR